MTLKVTHEELNKLIKGYYKQKDKNNKKISLLIYGTYGIGKSFVVRDTGQEIAEIKKKEFVEWNKISKEQKEKIYQNPEGYFVFMDIRLSEYSGEDIKGLPDFRLDKNHIEWKSPYWTKILEHPKSDGILFFDEISLATPLVVASTYKILYDRVVNESKLNDDWLLVGASNKNDDRAYTHELAMPVRDRCGEVELMIPEPSKWLSWAIKNDLDPRIIGYLSWKSSDLHPKANYEDEQKQTTSRGWERVNTLIKDLKDFDNLQLLSSSAIGEGIARSFVAFCKLNDDVELEEIVQVPETLKRLKEKTDKNLSLKYFIVTGLADWYKDNKMNFSQMIKVSEVFDEIDSSEMVILLWRLCSVSSKDKFAKDFLTKELTNKIRSKYASYLI